MRLVGQTLLALPTEGTVINLYYFFTKSYYCYVVSSTKSIVFQFMFVTDILPCHRLVMDTQPLAITYSWKHTKQ